MAVTEGQTENGLRRFVVTGGATRIIQLGEKHPDRTRDGGGAKVSARSAGVNASSINRATATADGTTSGRAESRGGGTEGFAVTEPRVRRNLFRRSDAGATAVARPDAGAGQGVIPHNRLSGS